MDANDISKLVELADSLVYEKTGQHLETVEKDILRQTLTGKKLSAIEFPSYENSYVQRFRAPKLWNRLSIVAGEKVQKKTVLEVLQRLQTRRSQSNTVPQSKYPANAQPENRQNPPLRHRSGQAFGIAQGKPSASLRASLRHRSGQAFGVAQGKPSAQLRGHPNYLNSCQACATRLLLKGQLRERSQAEHRQSKKAEDYSPDVTAQFQSSSQSQADNPDETKSSTYGLPNFRNFMNPGVPLLLSFGVVGCLFALSWLANWYGVQNHLAGQLPKSQLGYTWALKLNPLSAAAHYNQGATYEDQQNYERAHAEYQMAIEGGLIEAYNNQARLYILEGNYNPAVSLLRIGLDLAQDDRVRADMYKNQGWARLEQGRYAEAKLDLTEAIKLKSDRAPAYCLLAQVLEREGDKKGALVQWENCLGFAYQPNTPEEDKWVHLARQSLEAKGSGK